MSQHYGTGLPAVKTPSFHEVRGQRQGRIRYYVKTAITIARSERDRAHPTWRDLEGQRTDSSADHRHLVGVRVRRADHRLERHRAVHLQRLAKHHRRRVPDGRHRHAQTARARPGPAGKMRRRLGGGRPDDGLHEKDARHRRRRVRRRAVFRIVSAAGGHHRLP